MNGIKNSIPISRQGLNEIAYWIESDISKLDIEEAYNHLLGKCELMYSEVVNVTAGKTSSIYLELNDYDEKTLQDCTAMVALLIIELEVSYPVERDAS